MKLGSITIYRARLLIVISVVFLLIAGTSVVFADAGDLDAAFDADGKVTTDFGGSDYGYGVAI